MKKEIRVYVVDLRDSEVNSTYLEPEETCFKENEFINEAENQGSVYTLKSFQKALNSGDLYLGGSYVYFKEVEYND